jgi:enoyl-CoA hydratase/carnithine racemase
MPEVRYELEGKVARVTLNRPEKFNALTLEMLDSIAMSITDAEERCARVWVITGSGNSFCSGGDIELMKEALAGDVKRMFQSLTGKLRKCVVSIVKSPLICIASIPGVAVGAGLAIALACDVRIASQGAKFRAGYPNIGMTPNGGITFLLPRLVGASAAKDMLLTNRTVDAHEALRIELVSRVVDQETLANETNKLVNQILSGAPFTHVASKQFIDRHLRTEFEGHLDEEQALNVQSVTRKDFREGVEAFLEKRKPRFTGD